MSFSASDDKAMSLLREVAALAWPAAVQGLLTTVVFFTDRVILGSHSDEALGSMNISGPLLWSVFSVFGAISAGTMAVVGRAIGAGEARRAGEVMGGVLVMAGAMGVVVGVSGWSLRPAIAQLLAGGDQTSAVVRLMAQDYMAVIFAMAPLKLVADASFAALQASGDTRSPMWISGVCGGINLVLSWLLVNGQLGLPEWGVVGAAIGTATAFGLQGMMALWVARRPTSRLPLRLPPAGTWSNLRPVVRVSLPTLGEKSIYHTAYVGFAALVGWLGDVSMTAHQALIAIESLGFMASAGFGIAASAIVAQKLGAGDPALAARAGWWATGLAVFVLCGASVIFLVFPEELIGCFTSDPEVIRTGTLCLRVAAIAQPLMAVTDAMGGALRGAGDTRNPMLAAVAGPVVVRLTMCWTLAFYFELGLLGIWIGSCFDWLVRGTYLTVVYARGRWRSIEL